MDKLYIHNETLPLKTKNKKFLIRKVFTWRSGINLAIEMIRNSGLIIKDCW